MDLRRMTNRWSPGDAVSKRIVKWVFVHQHITKKAMYIVFFGFIRYGWSLANLKIILDHSACVKFSYNNKLVKNFRVKSLKYHKVSLFLCIYIIIILPCFSDLSSSTWIFLLQGISFRQGHIAKDPTPFMDIYKVCQSIHYKVGILPFGADHTYSLYRNISCTSSLRFCIFMEHVRGWSWRSFRNIHGLLWFAFAFVVFPFCFLRFGIEQIWPASFWVKSPEPAWVTNRDSTPVQMRILCLWRMHTWRCRRCRWCPWTYRSLWLHRHRLHGLV